MSYGLLQFGTTQYSSNTQESDEIKKYFVDLKKYVPDYISEFIPSQQILDAQGYQIGAINYYINDLVNQCFIDTATWGLSLWEKEYGISIITKNNGGV